MSKMTFAEAIGQAVREEMQADQRVFVMGQDVETFFLDEKTRQDMGPGRIRNTPITETGFIGAGIGAALTGMRPVIELGCSTFLYSAMDQVVNQAAKIRYMFGGQASVPLVIRAPVVYSASAAAHHSDRPWGLFAQAPGLKIVVPATPKDAKGLLKSAIRDGNPVLFFEDSTLEGTSGDVPDLEYTTPIGLAEVKQEGTDVTIVTLAAAVLHSLAAAEKLRFEGISAEVVDIRTVSPLDRATLMESVTKTGRLVVVDAAPGFGGVAAEIAALAAEHTFSSLKAPILRLTAPCVPVPFSPKLEKMLYPTVESIVAGVRKVVVEAPRLRATPFARLRSKSEAF